MNQRVVGKKNDTILKLKILGFPTGYSLDLQFEVEKKYTKSPVGGEEVFNGE